MNYRLATRQSPLALAQAELVVAALRQSQPHITVTVAARAVTADYNISQSVSSLGGKGSFVRQIDQMVQDGQADFAVHSYKDMSVTMPEGLCVAAVLPRAAAADVLLSQSVSALADLPDNAVIGTDSARRRFQLEQRFPQWQWRLCRGNVATRMAAMRAGEYDAIVLAKAGLDRLSLQPCDCSLWYELPFQVVLPAAGQGIIAVVCQEQRRDVLTELAVINHQPTWQLAQLEFAVVRGLGAYCGAPLAVYAHILSGGEYHVEVRLGGGEQFICWSGSSSSWQELSVNAVSALTDLGAKSRLMAWQGGQHD